MSFSGGSVVKNPPTSAGDTGDMGLIPGLGRSSREGNHNHPPQYSCLENSMDRRPWQDEVHGVARSWTWLRWILIWLRFLPFPPTKFIEVIFISFISEASDAIWYLSILSWIALRKLFHCATPGESGVTWGRYYCKALWLKRESCSLCQLHLWEAREPSFPSLLWILSAN